MVMAMPHASAAAARYANYTYDDIIVLPGEIDFGVDAVALETKVTKKIALKTPFVSSPMDTVTEANMAIAIAQHGGLGVIHYNMPVADQVAEVKKVKAYKNGFISAPVVMAPDQTIAELDDVKEKYGHFGIPITVDGKLHSKLVGIVTKRDVDFVEDREGTKSSSGMSTELVVARAGGLARRFVLARGEFRDAGAVVAPRRGPYYSLNDAREPDWPPGLRRWVGDAKRGATGEETPRTNAPHARRRRDEPFARDEVRHLVRARGLPRQVCGSEPGARSETT